MYERYKVGDKYGVVTATSHEAMTVLDGGADETYREDNENMFLSFTWHLFDTEAELDAYVLGAEDAGSDYCQIASIHDFLEVPYAEQADPDLFNYLTKLVKES